MNDIEIGDEVCITKIEAESLGLPSNTRGKITRIVCEPDQRLGRVGVKWNGSVVPREYDLPNRTTSYTLLPQITDAWSDDLVLSDP